MKSTRRKFFGLVGGASLATKAVADTEIQKLSGMHYGGGLGNSSLSLRDGEKGSYQTAKPIIGAADYVKVFGLPQVVEDDLRDTAKSVYSLDPDIACKRSWSMSVKIMTQRERNYARAVEKIAHHGWRQRGLDALQATLGFAWPRYW